MLLELPPLFDVGSIPWPDGIRDRLLTLEPDMERGDAVGYVFALLDPVVREAGYEILDLNNGGDSHWIFLAPASAVARWRNVALGEGVRLESPEWQYSSVLQRLGLSARYPGHPSRSLREPPDAR